MILHFRTIVTTTTTVVTANLASVASTDTVGLTATDKTATSYTTTASIINKIVIYS